MSPIAAATKPKAKPKRAAKRSPARRRRPPEADYLSLDADPDLLGPDIDGAE